MERMAKTATAAAMALLIAGGAALPAGAVLPGALSGDTITANAYVDVNFDKQTGVLTFSGNISRMLTRSWNYESGVKKIVFGPGSVLDADSSTMFRCYNEVEEIDLTNADTSNVTDMSSMFAVCPALKKITFGSNFTTKKVWDMSYMFEGCSSLEEIDLSQFDTYSVSDMSGMFSGCISLRSIDLRYIRTDHATNMACMFCNCHSLSELDVSGFVTKGVTDMSEMFHNCFNLKSLDLSSFDTGRLQYCAGMFEDCGALKTITVHKFDVSGTEISENMFKGCLSLAGGCGTAYSSTFTDKTRACTDNLPVKAGYFTQRGVSFAPSTGVLTISGDKFDRDDVWAFRENTSVKKVKAAPNTRFPEDCSYMFGSPEAGTFWKNLSSFDLFEADTRHVRSIGGMFAFLTKLTSIDLSTFDTRNVLYMDFMFDGCTALKTVDISGFDTSNTYSMGYMFNNCSALKTIYAGDKWCGAEETFEMFSGCTSIMGAYGTTYDSLRTDGSYARIDGMNSPGYFTKKDVAFRTNSMTLGGSIVLNFYVQLDEIPEDKLPQTYVEFEVNGKKSTSKFDPDKRNKNGYYGFTCPINSVSMADSVRATLHFTDPYGKSRTIRTRTTAETYLSKFSSADKEKTWNLIKAINDYGYYMQRYLCNHSASHWVLGTDHVAMEDAYLKTWKLDTIDSEAAYKKALADFKKTKTVKGGIQDIKYSLVLDSETTLNVKIKPKSSYKGSIKITVDGKTVSPTTLSDGRLQVSVRNIPAHKLGDYHIVKITTGSDVSVFKASALSYACDCLTSPVDDSEKHAMAALYEYYKATIAYKQGV